MRTTGIILIVIGILNFIIKIMALAHGDNPPKAFLMFIVLGSYLVHRANKKKEKEKKKNNWGNDN